jgi:eukaryotic-like serine/threonine-protein kinase
MNPPAPSREEEIFSAAVALPVAERATYLEKACRGDAGLRQRIEGLLQSHDHAEDFMQDPAAGDVGRVVTQNAPPPSENLGRMIGRYKLLQKIGEGGCGTVYLAEQQEPVRRRVALKVIKLGMDTKEVIARFEAERQALALMDHLNIARVFDAGATEAGRPFFVMELVRGVPITKYCDEQNLPTGKRLELFTQVCHAVQHAHQKGIIHRDLKPSNILVTLNDDVPVPKVIDFGIAKATQGGLTDRTLFTAFEQFIGTPAYMAPEQAEMTSMDIDTRSDIYSLGVLLYELLAGRPPFDPKSLVSAGLAEIRRIIREVEPPRPSTRLDTLSDIDRASIARQRGILPRQLSTLLSGDLDWIVMRCLEKDRTRRYETANGLALDVLRHLQNEPVVARPPSATYRLKKLVRRNKLAFAASATVAFAVVAGVAVASWQAVRATRAERAATAEAALSQAVSEFLTVDLLRQADSSAQMEDSAAPNPDLKVREALNRAAQKVGKRFERQPLTEAAVRHAIGTAFHGVGDAANAALQHGRAVQLRKQALGAEHRSTLTSMTHLGDAYHAQGKFSEAESLHGQTLQIRTRLLGPEHPETLASMSGLGLAHHFQGKFEKAADVHARVLEIRQRVEGPEHPATLASMNNLALTLKLQGKLVEAAALQARTLEIQQRVLGAEHPETLKSMNNLGFTYYAQRKFSAAATLHERTLEIRKRTLGPEHPRTLTSMSNLAAAYQAQGKFAEALALNNSETLEIRKRVLGPEHPETLSSMQNLAESYRRQGKFSAAVTLHAHTLEIRQRVLGAEHPSTLKSRDSLAHAYRSQGKLKEAEALIRETLLIERRLKVDVTGSLMNLGHTLAAQGLGAEAGGSFREVLKLRQTSTDPMVGNAFEGLQQLLLEQGKLDDALALSREEIEYQRVTFGVDHSNTLSAMRRLAAIHWQRQEFREGEALYREVLGLLKKKEGTDSLSVALDLKDLGNKLLNQNQPAKAESLYRESLAIFVKTRPDDWRLFETRSRLGRALVNQRKYAVAEPLLLSGYEGLHSRAPDLPNYRKDNVRNALARVVHLYTRWDKPDKAAEWQKNLDALDAISQSKAPEITRAIAVEEGGAPKTSREPTTPDATPARKGKKSGKAKGSLSAADHNRNGRAKQMTGDLSGAIADYGKAIAADPTAPLAHLNRGHLQQAMGNYVSALADYDRGIAVTTDYAPYARLHRWVVQRRLKHPDASRELALALAEWAGNGWSKTICRYLLGELSESQLLAVPAKPDSTTTRPRLGEALYFAGMVHLLNDDPNSARPLFEQSVATNEKDHATFVLARAELARLPPAAVVKTPPAR